MSSYSEGLLIAAIIILMYIMLVDRKEKQQVASSTGQVAATQTAGGGESFAPKAKLTPEQYATSQNLEHFYSSSLMTAKNEMLGLDPDHAFGAEGFMSPSQDFKDYITGLAVDQQVVKNHTEFVKDRVNGTDQNILGKTYAMPDEIETDSTPWMGLRRPQAVPTDGNTTQLTDNSEYGYTTKPTFSWRS